MGPRRTAPEVFGCHPERARPSSVEREHRQHRPYLFLFLREPPEGDAPVVEVQDVANRLLA